MMTQHFGFVDVSTFQEIQARENYNALQAGREPRQLRVFLNGEDSTHDCVSADDINGVVVRNARHPEMKQFYLIDVNGERTVAKEVLRGEVTIRFVEPKHYRVSGEVQRGI